MPKDVLNVKMLQDDLLYSNKEITTYSTNNDRRTHYTTTPAVAENRIDKNLPDRIAKF